MAESTKLTVDNHLERDVRLEHWTPWGLGGGSYPTEKWIEVILSINHQIVLPEILDEMFERAQACMVYGCYHYPLFTLAMEELFRFGESAFREAIKETGVSNTILRKKYADLQVWAYEKSLIDDASLKQWQASRSLRNMTSHKDSKLLLGPNDAIGHLDIAVKQTEALFKACRLQAQTP